MTIPHEMADIGNGSSLPCSRLSYLFTLSSRGSDSLPAGLQYTEIAFQTWLTFPGQRNVR